jgi:hypothetical protein
LIISFCKAGDLERARDHLKARRNRSWLRAVRITNRKLAR